MGTDMEVRDKDYIPIVTIAGHSYFPGVAVTVASIARAASDKRRLQFHILTDDLTEEDRKELTRLCRLYGVTEEVVVHRPDLVALRAVCPEYKGSVLTWMSLFVCEYLPSDAWCVYTDADTLWFKDVCELWKMRRSEKSVFWCRDLPQTQRAVAVAQRRWNPDFVASDYCCNAVSLMNLEKMRREGFVGRVQAFIAKWGCPYYCDQDIQNHLWHSSCEFLDPTWNCMTAHRAAVNGANLHCLGIARHFRLGKMLGWNARNALWFSFYSRFVLGEPRRFPETWYKRVWLRVFGFFYPVRGFWRILAGPLGRNRVEKLVDLQFFAWLWRRKNG